MVTDISKLWLAMKDINERYIMVEYAWLMSERPNGVEVYNKEELKRNREHIKIVNELRKDNVVYLKNFVTSFKFGYLTVLIKFSKMTGQLAAEQSIPKYITGAEYDFTYIIKDRINKKNRRLTLVGNTNVCVSNGVYELTVSTDLDEKVYLSNRYTTLTTANIFNVANKTSYKGCIHTILKNDEPLVGGDIFGIDIRMLKDSSIDVERLHEIHTGNVGSNMYIDFSKSRLQYLGEDAFLYLREMLVKAVIELGDRDVYFSKYIDCGVDSDGTWSLTVRTSRKDVYNRLIEAATHDVLRRNKVSPVEAWSIKKSLLDGTGKFKVVYTGEHNKIN